MVGMVDTLAPTSRVLKLFSLTVPPLVFLMITYISLTEYVFGLSYVVGRRLGKRLRKTLRVGYILFTSIGAGLLHVGLLSRCALGASMDVSALCPDVLLTEHSCLAPSASACLMMLLALFVERISVPMLDLSHFQPYEIGTYARVTNGVAIAIVWFCMAEAQLGALLLLGILTARRALVLFPRSSKLYALFIKLYTVLHMSKVIAHRCNGSRRLSVATTVAILSL